MKFTGKIPLLIVIALAWIVVISSCANLGMPTGGPRDSIPPVLLETTPEFKALNYKGDEVRFTFDEYINTDNISEELVISPPLAKRPVIRTKSKTLIIEFNEDLKDSATYSLDFKNSIADNNEKNPYKNMRFSFSNWDVYDSLRVAGRVMNAFNLEHVEKSLIMLYRNLHDSAVFTLRPDYIAKTDETGMFLIDNIAPGKYHLFSISDANNNMKYDESAEEIAFVDSLIIPSATFRPDLDTMVSGVDSFLILGHTHFYPNPVYMHQFTEDIFDQYVDSYKRESANQCVFVFGESVKDTFMVNVINKETKPDWYQLEYNEKMDSLILWIADTTLVKTDSLLMEISYFQLDSAKQLYVHKDTLEMNFTKKVGDDSKRKKKSKEEEEKPEPTPQFSWKTSLSSTTVELNEGIGLIAPEPIATFDPKKIRLFHTEDSLKTPLLFTIAEDTTAWRRYNLLYKWEPETEYTLEIDSAACINIYGITSKKFTKKFSSREEDYYGSLNMILTGVEMPMLVQLVKNDDNENVVREKSINEDGNVLFEFLPPGKLKIKVIYDKNDNGKWDNGSYQDKIQPERVAYVNEIHKVRSNWSEEIRWDVKPDPTFVKNIRDYELEEQKRKEAEKKAREDAQREQKQNNSNLMQGGGSNILRQ
ncbi:MAG: Ig-like domain-containing domain [Draconibacterium sp.]